MVVHNSTKKTRITSEERTNSSSVASECEPFSNQKFELFRQNHHTGLLQCIECQAGPFSSRSKLLKHLMTHNEEQKRCQKCKILHPSISSAQNHICGHSTTTTSDNTSTVRKKQQLFHCPSCTYVCKRATSLKSHSLVHLQKSEITRLKCHQCNKFTCGRMSELRRHIKTKHGDKNDVSSTINNNRNKKNCEKIQCDHCPYASASRQHFARHMELVHAKALCHGSKEGSTNMVYRCRLCPYSTSQMDNLRKHVLKTTKHPGESMYQCLWCEYRCNLQLDFRSHILKFHPQEDAENTINEYFSMKPTTSK